MSQNLQSKYQDLTMLVNLLQKSLTSSAKTMESRDNSLLYTHLNRMEYLKG